MLRWKTARFLSANDGGGAGGGGFGGGSDGGAAQPEQAGQQEQSAEQTEKEQTEETEAAADGAADKTDAEAKVDAEEISKQVDAKVEEALKVAAMPEEEKAEYAIKKREESLLRKEQEINRKELKLNAEKLLVSAGLSGDISEIILGADMKETALNIKKFKSAVDAEVQKKVTERLKGKAPSAGNHSPATETDKVKSEFSGALNSI